jgi:nucleoside-diphosphate-sugar epimerase
MIKILITGAKSFIGVSFVNWLRQWPEQYEVNTLNMIDGSWRKSDFSPYNAVFHVAGIAHVSPHLKQESLYYKINRDLAIETAGKAKAEGVRQFIFMSSIIVYGDSSHINNMKVIDQSTQPVPTNSYGDSKLKAEASIQAMADDHFKVVVLRPPMIYGKGSKGNYPKLAWFARNMPVFPDIDNERSLLYVGNLCEFVRLMIENEENGLFFPQNKEYVKTSELVQNIANAHHRKIILTRMFNPLIRLLGSRILLINKIFGNLVYDQSLSEYKIDYRLFDLRTSILQTEKD